MISRIQTTGCVGGRVGHVESLLFFRGYCKTPRCLTELSSLKLHVGRKLLKNSFASLSCYGYVKHINLKRVELLLNVVVNSW